MFNGMVTTVPSFVQVMFGSGFPSAEQFKNSTTGTATVWRLEVTMILGGAKNKLITG